MENFVTPYPLLWNDGEKLHNKGMIGVHSLLTSKKLRALVSQKTGYPTNQISLVFVCKRLGSDKQQKLPINENTDFNIILNQHHPSQEKDCLFLVSLKKSKKGRRSKARRSILEASDVNIDVIPSVSHSSIVSANKPCERLDASLSLEAESPKALLWKNNSSKQSGSFLVDDGGTCVVKGEKKLLLRRGGQGNMLAQPTEWVSAYPTSSQGFDVLMYSHPHLHRFSSSSSPSDVLQRSYEEAHRLRLSMLLPQQNGMPFSLAYATPPHPLPRVSLANSNAASKLQETQAHYRKLQNQDCVQMHMSCEMLAREFPSEEEDACENKTRVCRYCHTFKEKNITPIPFHLCVYDPITRGIKGPSPAGAIGTPVKRAIVAA